MVGAKLMFFQLISQPVKLHLLKINRKIFTDHFVTTRVDLRKAFSIKFLSSLPWVPEVFPVQFRCRSCLYCDPREKPDKPDKTLPVADPDFELRWGPGFGLLALPAFLPSVISFFFLLKIRRGPPRPLP